MYTAKIMNKDGKGVNLELKSESRNAMRQLKILCDENKLTCNVTEEVKPREVKFKNL